MDVTILILYLILVVVVVVIVDGNKQPRVEPDLKKCITPGFQSTFLQVMRWNPCFKCVCASNDVCKVKRQSCPLLSCTLQEYDPRKCCRVCKGCVVDGSRYKNKQIWRVEGDNCSVYQCNEGIVSKVTPRCVATCSNPNTVKGSCCPTCDGCVHEGEVITNGSHHRFGSCRNCSCKGGKLICEEQTCPHLHCLNQIKNEGECCPKCVQDASPTYVNIKETTCRVKDTMVENGDEYKMNKCTTCKCRNGTLSCVQEECKTVLRCSTKDLVHSEKHCCPVCRDKIICKYNGKTYKNNEKWFLKGCAVCVCKNGQNMCSKQTCRDNIKCRRGFTKSIRPGSCCLECMPEKHTCIAFGDPHYRTFDGRAYSYQGICKYTLTKDCTAEKSFHVMTRNYGHQSNYFSWIKTVTFLYANLTIVLQQNNKVKISGINVRVPFLYYPYLEIRKSKRYLFVYTNSGITIKWDGVNYIEVSLPNTYKNKVCGLCGNFNNNPDDDFRIENIGVSNSTVSFGDYWRHATSKSCKSLKRRHVNKKTITMKCVGWKLQHAHRVCRKAFSDRSILKCKWSVDSNRYFQDCITDVCQCGSQRFHCECGAIRSYFNRCSQMFSDLTWKMKDKCDVSCDGGSVYSECGPACKPTCNTINSVQSCRTKNCVSGCHCPVGFVWEKGKCILPFECPLVQQ